MDDSQWASLSDHFKFGSRIKSEPTKPTQNKEKRDASDFSDRKYQNRRNLQDFTAGPGGIYEKEVKQTRPGWKVPPNQSAHEAYQQMFAGFGNNGEWGPGDPEYDDSPNIPYLPGSIPNEPSNEPMEEFTFARPEDHFDPYSDAFNTEGVYEPGKIDGYVDQLH